MEAGVGQDRPLASDGAMLRVYRGIMQALEEGTIVPGQRLAEVDLARQHGVGRNAVREAMQRLAARGVIDISRHRSPTVRRLDTAEALEVLDVAEAMIALACRQAAIRYDAAAHDGWLDAALEELDAAHGDGDPVAFSRGRRALYRAILSIAGNRELTRLFPGVGIHVIYARHRSRELQEVRLADYHAMRGAIVAKDAGAANDVAARHVANVRRLIRQAAAPRIDAI